MPKTMKALVFKGRKKIVYQDAPIPTIKDDEILMKIKSVGICGTDLHMYRGGLKVKLGTIPGHEFSGTVARVGKLVSNFKKGDRVVAEHVITCQQCEYCKTGRPNLCDSRTVVGLDRPGALAQYLAIPADLVYLLPKSITYEEAALIEPLSIAVYAAKQAGYLLGKRVAVIGQGPIGLLVDQALSAGGALVTGIDVRQHALDFAKQQGWAHHVINSKTQQIRKRMQEINSPDGFDIVFEAVGIEQTAAMSFAITRRDGSVYLLGVFALPSRINLMHIVKKELNVHGSWTCAFSFPDSIDLVTRKKVDLKRLITHRYPASRGAEAFAEASQYTKKRIKTVINF